MQYKESSFSFIAEVHPVLLEQKNLAYAKNKFRVFYLNVWMQN